MTGQTAVQPAASTGVAVPERILFGRTEAMRALRARIEKVAPTKVPVLIMGENGVGKEVMGRYVHSRSPWRDGPFVRINCPGIPGSPLESELFGHEKDASSGMTAKAGLVESACNGTLFLDGIGELELPLQSKVLQFLRDNKFRRIGGQEILSADIRVICAASHLLENEIESGRFRRDLFYRINVVTVHVPPLRERRGDIPELIDYFLQTFSHEFGRSPQPIRASTRDLLVQNDWPGNIGQLENLIKRYVILDTEDAIVSDLGWRAPNRIESSSDASDVSLKQVTRTAKQDIERKVILDALSANHWNRRKTAAALHISYRALLYKIKQGGLSPHPANFSASKGLND